MTGAADLVSGNGSQPGQTARGMRNMGRLVKAALRLIWAAGRRDFVIVMVMDLLQGLGFFVLIRQAQQMLSGLIAINAGKDAPGLALDIVIFMFANMLGVVTQAVIANRKVVLSELTGIYVCGEVLKVACLAELADFDDSRFHDRLQRAATSAQTRPSRMVQSLVTIGQTVVALISIWFALLTVQWVLALCVALVVVPIWYGGTRGGDQYFGFVRKTTSTDRSRTYLFGLLTMRDPAKEIRAFNLADHLSQTWHTLMNQRLDLLRTTLKKRFRWSVISSVGSSVVIALASVVLVELNRWHVLTLAQTATAAGALLLFSQKVFDSMALTNDFFESAPLMGDLDEFLALQPALIRNREGERLAGGFEDIELDDVSFTYHGAERRAIDEVSLKIRAGQVVALVGENGSGKTTLAKLLAGLYSPQTGAIRVDGTDLSTVDLDSWRESVAVLFQDFIRYALTAEENIRLGAVSEDTDFDQVRAAAIAAGADEFLSRLPDGYRTILSPQFGSGQDLSLGQWQRVALARAFLRDAPLVILDEPTASLDARAERALFDSVRDLYRNRTVLLISHRFATVWTADHIVVLRDGKIIEQGSHTALMAADGLYAELFAIQASVFTETDLDDTDHYADAGEDGVGLGAGRGITPHAQ
ncbi:MAG: ABC transporter ATP-binding protein [Catenulispora sp.]|nr:ABC transporter ATP-binding protein [Catenulispora sp.]